MIPYLIITALTAALIALGLALGLWLRHETQRADSAERALTSERLARSNAFLDLEHLEEQLGVQAARYDREISMLKSRIEQLHEDLANCRDPDIVLRLLREAMR